MLQAAKKNNKQWFHSFCSWVSLPFVVVVVDFYRLILALFFCIDMCIFLYSLKTHMKINAAQHLKRDSKRKRIVKKIVNEQTSEPTKRKNEKRKKDVLTIEHSTIENGHASNYVNPKIS